MTYELSTVAEAAAEQTLDRRAARELPGDVEHRYCGRCHLFHHVVEEARELYRRFSATHDCGEWRTWRGVCAVCSTRVAP